MTMVMMIWWMLLIAKTEMEMYTDLFNKISSSCFQKCASRRHRDQDLSLGEMTCTGTCTMLWLGKLPVLCQ